MKTEYLLRAMAASCGLFTAVNPALGQTWTQTSAPITNWSAIACSADGSRLVAAVKGGPIYTSPDSGATWMATSAPSTNWSAVASSADGSKLVAASAVFNGSQYQSSGPIYVSADSGVTWTMTTAPETNWSAVASSADGRKLVAVAGGGVVYITSAPFGPIYTSADSGATWTATSVTNANCTAVASSADGSNLVASQYPGKFYFSRDSGVVWEVVTPTFPYLVSVAASADGARMVAGTFNPFHPPGSGGNGSFYASTNSGLSWQSIPAGDLGRGLVASSADGTTQAAALGANAFGRPGSIFVTTNSGSTWNVNGAPVERWSSIACSADGGTLAAVIDGGGIWTLQSTPAPKLNLAKMDGSLLLSLTVPSLPFVLQESANLTTTNWTDVLTPPTLNLTNLQNQVTVPPASGSRFYRLKH